MKITGGIFIHFSVFFWIIKHFIRFKWKANVFNEHFWINSFQVIIPIFSFTIGVCAIDCPKSRQLHNQFDSLNLYDIYWENWDDVFFILTVGSELELLRMNEMRGKKWKRRCEKSIINRAEIFYTRKSEKNWICGVIQTKKYSIFWTWKKWIFGNVKWTKSSN